MQKRKVADTKSGILTDYGHECDELESDCGIGRRL